MKKLFLLLVMVFATVFQLFAHELIGDSKPKFNYLTFTAQESNSSVGIVNNNNNPDIEYSVDCGKTWQKLTEQDPVVLRNVGDNMLVRGNNPDGFSKRWYHYSYFRMTGKIAASGSVMSLIDGKGETLAIPSGECCFTQLFYFCKSLTSAPELPATTLALGCYHEMFTGCINLRTAPKLPATKLAERCYIRMFSYCERLRTAPKLPATTLAEFCYVEMFAHCQSLKNAPKLPATVLTIDCYSSMFESCPALKTAPKLPATTLAEWCYDEMFEGCTGLKTAPKLPATTLAEHCYYYMFSGCTRLAAAPKLPATALVKECYKYMFRGCDNLKSVRVRFVDWKYDSKLIDEGNYDLNSTGDWLQDVASSGTFYCPRALKKEFGRSHIPEGWEVKYID